MDNLPIYQFLGGGAIYYRIYHPATNKVWDNTEEELAESGDTTLADTRLSASWDSVIMNYSITAPSGLPTDREYDIVFYKDEENMIPVTAYRVYLDPIKGFIKAGEQHFPMKE